MLSCLAACTPLPAASLLENDGLNGGLRWDAAPRTINGWERSLDGGLRFSVSGGSYVAFRDQFAWEEVPTESEFQQAVEQAFRDWTVIDPATGLGTVLAFVPDFATEVVGAPPTEEGDPAGAEIDLLAVTDAVSWDPGETRRRGEAFLDMDPGTVTLTSGTTGYQAQAISGADIRLNSNPEAAWNLNSFRLVLAHELGHAIGLGDVDILGPDGNFIDDNYDDTSAETSLATLTNSWAALVNPYDPASSPLGIYTVANGLPGVDTHGVHILMETVIPNALLEFPTLLQNDDFGGRQFLYPSPFPHMPGDYNGDGNVGADDYVIWQSTFGQRGIGLAADANQNGVVDAADYVLWRNAALDPNPQPKIVVPEPAVDVLVLTLAFGAGAGYVAGARPSRSPSSASTSASLLRNSSASHTRFSTSTR
jgi:hypothetical protein